MSSGHWSFQISVSFSPSPDEKEKVRGGKGRGLEEWRPALEELSVSRHIDSLTRQGEDLNSAQEFQSRAALWREGVQLGAAAPRPSPEVCDRRKGRVGSERDRGDRRRHTARDRAEPGGCCTSERCYGSLRRRRTERGSCCTAHSLPWTSS